MANVARDENRIPTIAAVSNADPTVVVPLYADPTTHRLLTSASGSTTPGGSDTQVQFNDGGALSGEAGFTYNKTTDTATLAGDVKADRIGMEDTDSSHYLYVEPGSNLTADRVLTVTTGDADRTLTVSGNATISQDYSTTGNPQFATIELGAASDTTLSRSAAGVVAVEGVDLVKISGAQTLTNKTLTSPVINTPTGIVKGDVGLGNVDNTSDATKNSATATLTNKRITARVQSVSNAATVTPDADANDCVDITAIAQAFTIANPTGTPTNFQKLIIRIKDNGTARAITFGSGYVAGGVSLPTTTVLSKILTLGFLYNTANSLNKWQLVASASEA